MTLSAIFSFGFVVMITHLIEGITGFGCTALALPFTVLLVGIKTAVPLLVILGLLSALYIVIISFKNIVWHEYWQIVILVILGLPVGIILFRSLPVEILELVLAVFMIVLSTRGLYVSFTDKKIIVPNKRVLKLFLFLGGCIHGAFGTGGPLVILYATVALPHKSNFRATLCLLWVTLNTIIVLQSLADGIISVEVIKLLLFSMPFLITGTILGNWLHHKVNEGLFLKLVYLVLLLSGTVLLVKIK